MAHKKKPHMKGKKESHPPMPDDKKMFAGMMKKAIHKGSSRGK